MQTITKVADLFKGCVSVEKTKLGFKPWRIKEEERLLYPSPNEGFLEKAMNTSGVRLRFKTNSKILQLNLLAVNPIRKFDLVIDNEIVQTVELLGGKKVVTFNNLPGKLTVMEIWFPSNQGIELKSIEIEDGKNCVPVKDKRKKWVAYGSSITQCGEAQSPANIWTGVAARDLDLNLTSLGFGGQCHIDPMMTKTIRDLPADFISLKLGINIMGAASLSHRSFRPAVIGIVQTIREKHPKTPILLISPVCSPPREDKTNVVDLNLKMMRDQMHDAFKRLKKVTGDKNLYYISGLKLADQKLAEKYMPDNLHPNGEGYIKMGKNFVKHLPAELKRYLKA
jgi:hypothetical protein